MEANPCPRKFIGSNELVGAEGSGSTQPQMNSSYGRSHEQLLRRKKRKLTLPTMSGERYQPNFKWIDATAPPARREINLHARRETQRARLWRGQRRGLKDRQSLARLSKYSWRSGAEPPESNAPFDRPLSGSDEHGFSEAAPSSKATKTSSVGVLGDFPSDAVLYSPYPHGGLQDAVTTSRRDPFLSLPLVTSREDQALIDHCRFPD